LEIDHSQLEQLILRPGESLNVELKRWIDPNECSGIAKIVRASLAIRNRNGGYLIFGFDDKTLQPDIGHELPDVRSAFHVDKIQTIISRFSSELFEIGVTFVARDAQDYPVISIPSGVRTPVAAKIDLFDSDRKYVSRGDVYFRTLAANGTSSTSIARPEDWRDILEICFDNREADIGRFMRRQLAGRDVASLISAIAQLGLGQSVPAKPSLSERAEALLNDGDRRFQIEVAERPEDRDEKLALEAGKWSIAVVVDPPHAARVPDRAFLSTLDSSNPRYTGWPVWLDSTGFTDQRHVPKVRDKAWEALILSVRGWSKHLDFSRLDPKGEFYLLRALQDDLSDQVPTRTALDPILVVIRVAEAIAVGLAFAKALGWSGETTRLGFAFRWTKLSQRNLAFWAHPMVDFGPIGKAHDDSVTTFTELTLDTPASAIGPFVEQATKDLFALFDGHKMPTDVIEDWSRRVVERRLGG
jgi:hypothetical protein